MTQGYLRNAYERIKGVFSQNDKIQTADFNFLKAVVAKLPSKYEYLAKQVSPEFLLGKKVNTLGEAGTYTLILDAGLAEAFCNRDLVRFFILKGIRIWDAAINDYAEVELHILEGMLAGFKVISDYSLLDFENIVTTELFEKSFPAVDQEELSMLIGKPDRNIAAALDLSSTFKIELPEGTFYTIKNLGDGNYLAIKTSGQIYSLIHDPYELRFLFESKEVLFQALQNGNFKTEEYIERKA